MAGIYESMWFSKATPGQNATPQAQGEAPTTPYEANSTCDSIYESLQLGPVVKGLARHGTQQSKESCCSARPLPLGLLAACLALLATTIALGVCYWQQEQRLQQVDTVLVQAQAELAQTQAELLHMKEQDRVLQEQLSISESAWASAQPCHVTDCCPETWVLHCGKCLFLSKEKKTWLESKQACERESSWLFIPSDWDHTTMLSFLAHMDTLYWIGLQWRWDLKTQSDRWQWLDGSPYKWHGSAKVHGYFGTIKGGRIESGGQVADKHHWICEKPAVCPLGPSRTKRGA